jgi:hypothetical protein
MNIKSQTDTCLLCSPIQKENKIEQILTEVKHSTTPKMLRVDSSPICRSCMSRLIDYGVKVSFEPPRRNNDIPQLIDA